MSRRSVPAARALGGWQRTDKERGDVPGWVLITLMTAMLVSALLIVARPRLVALFEQAMDSLT